MTNPSIKSPTAADAKLEPCPVPWCGSENVRLLITATGGRRVICRTCFVWGPDKPTDTEAIAAWNTRTATNRASEEQDQGASLRDRAGRAPPQAPTGLDHTATIPCARIGETLATHIARTIALHGLGTVSGSDRFTPPNAEWDEAEWRFRILDVIPAVAEALCLELADVILAIVAESAS